MEPAPTQQPAEVLLCRPPLPAALKAGLGLTLVLSIVLFLINQLLHTGQAPQGIVNLQLAGTAEHTRDIMQSWSPQQQMWAKISLLLDFLHVAVYFATLVALTRHLLKDRPGVRERTTGRGVLVLFTVAAASDCLENLLLLVNMSDPTDLPSMIATLAALVKFTGLLLGCAGLVIIRAARRHPLEPC